MDVGEEIMSEAPTIHAQVIYSDSMGMSGKGHYMGMGPGTPVTIEPGPTGVSVITTCCGTNIGDVDSASGSALKQWMDKGVFFACVVRDAASVVGGYVGPIVQRPMVIRCEPMKGKLKSVEKEKVKELDDA